MKALGILATAVLLSSSVFAQNNNKKEYKLTANSAVNSQVSINTNNTETINASGNAQSSAYAAKHTKGKSRRKEAGSTSPKQAETDLQSEASVQTESVESKKNEVVNASNRATQELDAKSVELKSQVSAQASQALDAGSQAVTETSGELRHKKDKAKAVRAEGAVSTATSLQIRRSGLTSIGAISRLHL